jgi:hypothetical protein
MSMDDLNGIAEQLNASLSADSPAPVVPSQPSLSDTPETPTAPASVQGDTASTPQDDVIEVTFKDGVKQAVKRSELPNYMLRQEDYTRKTTQLAELRKRYEALEQNAPRIREELEFAQQMREAVSDPEALFKYVVEQLGPQKAIQLFSGQVQKNPGAYDPNDIPTYKEADDLINNKLSAYEQKLQAQEQAFERKLEERVIAERKALEFERQKTEYASKFNTLIEKSFNENPGLKAIDLAEDLMRFKVVEKIKNFERLNGYEPPFEQAAQWLQDAVKEQVTKLDNEYGARRANSPLNNGIEPPGGNRPVNVNTQRRSYYDEKTGQLDTDTQLKDLEAQIRNLSRL